MSWRDAPLYVEAHDLAAWVLERTGGWRVEAAALAGATSAAACDLVTATSLALTFPDRRAVHLEQADESIVRLRTLLRLARRLGWLSAGGLRFAAGRLRAIGRMVGGWRKRVRHTSRRQTREAIEPTTRGDGPPAARTA